MQLKYYWKKLKTLLTLEQVFYITVIMVFLETVRVRQNVGGQVVLCKKHVAETVRNIPDYDFKESILKLSGRIEWELLEQDTTADTVANMREYLYNSLQQAWRTGELMKQSWVLRGQIWMLAERDGLLIPTPDSILELLKALFMETRIKNMLDMCSGTSHVGIALWKRMNAVNSEGSYTGVEKEPVLSDIARSSLYLEGVNRGKIIQRDILETVTDGNVEQYDFIFADIPQGNIRPIVPDERDVRIKGIDSKKIYADWIFIQDMLLRLGQGGYAAVLVTSGVLIRENEKQLRRRVIEHDWLEAVISLPANLYTGIHTTTELLIFHKGRSPERQGKVLFVDVSAFCCRRQRNAYDISYEGIRTVARAFCDYQEQADISVICDREALEWESISWKPVTYLKRPGIGRKMLKLYQIADIVRGAQIKPDEIRMMESDVRFINVKDIQNGQICYETAEKVDDGRLAGKPQFKIREDDILLISKGTLIKLAIADKPEYVGYISGNITILRVYRNYYHPYVLYDYLQSEEGHNALESIQSGTTIRILNNANLRNLDIPEYPLELMEEVGEKLRENRLTYERKKKELAVGYAREAEKLQKKLRGGTVKDGKNFSKS